MAHGYRTPTKKKGSSHIDLRAQRKRLDRLYAERRNEVTRTAKDYQKQAPGLEWEEALRLAEKHVPRVVV